MNLLNSRRLKSTEEDEKLSIPSKSKDKGFRSLFGNLLKSNNTQSSSSSASVLPSRPRRATDGDLHLIRNRLNLQAAQAALAAPPSPEIEISLFTTSQQLLLAISTVLESHCSTQDCPKEVATNSPGVTRFHSVRIPDVSIRAYIERVVRMSRINESALVIVIILLDRVSSKIVINFLTVHRLLITACLIACKYLEDTFVSTQAVRP